MIVSATVNGRKTEARWSFNIGSNDALNEAPKKGVTTRECQNCPVRQKPNGTPSRTLADFCGLKVFCVVLL